MLFLDVYQLKGVWRQHLKRENEAEAVAADANDD
jgi:hypothetical protein